MPKVRRLDLCVIALLNWKRIGAIEKGAAVFSNT